MNDKNLNNYAYNQPNKNFKINNFEYIKIQIMILKLLRLINLTL